MFVPSSYSGALTIAHHGDGSLTITHAAGYGDAAGVAHLSADGLAFLTREEGIRTQVYNDATGAVLASYDDPGLKMNGGKGYPTIALGLALLTPELRAKYAPYLAGGARLTGAALAATIHDTIAPREQQLARLLAGIPATQQQFDALFSWVYNRGAGNPLLLAAIAKLRAGNRAAAAAAIAAAGAVEHVPYIAARRAREAAYFLGGGAAGSAAAAATSGTGIAVLGLLGATWLAYRKGWI